MNAHLVSELELKRSENIIKVYQSRVKSQIIQILSIYRELSTRQIADMLSKSKTTILRNMETEDKAGLVDLDLVGFKEKQSSGKYPKRVYYLKNIEHIDPSEQLNKLLHDNPSLVIEYNNYRLSLFTELKGIIDSSISYLQRLGDELEKNKDNPDELLNLRKDNLGALSFNYLSKTQLRNLVNPIKQHVDDDEIKEYLNIRMILPIKRLIEMHNKDYWEKDGGLWFYRE